MGGDPWTPGRRTRQQVENRLSLGSHYQDFGLAFANAFDHPWTGITSESATSNGS